MKPYKILILEEEASIRMFAKMFLEEKKYQVDVAATLEEGTTKLKEGKFDVIIFDFNLPDFKGAQMMQTFKKISPNSFIFVMSSDVDTQGREHFISLGADEAFSKSSDWFLEIDTLIKNVVQQKKTKS